MRFFKIYLIRSGDLDQSLLLDLLTDLKDVFQAEIEIYSDDFPTLTEAHDKRRDQYIAETYIEYIRALDFYDTTSIRIVVVTSVDLFSPMMNYVFGIAEHPGKGAVVSTYRLNFNEHDGKRMYTRLLKEVMHELGHTFGLSHCSDPKCAMAFATTVLDVDKKNSALCDRCSTSLQNGQYKNN